MNLNLITHDWNGSVIAQLSEATKISKYDVPSGYVNLTQMCKACEKKFNHYASLNSTKAYWEGLSLDTGIPASKLVITIRGRGDKIPQGTWGHPEIAIDLAQWVSVEFRIWANRTLRKVIETEANSTKLQISPEELIRIYGNILAPTSLSEELKATYLLRAIEAQFPEISPSVQKILPGIQPKSDEEYVSPTKLAQIWNNRHGTNIKAYQINNALEEVGLQTSYYSERISTKTGKLKRTKSYSPTERGNDYSIFILDKAGSNKTVQHLRWKASVLPEIAKYLNVEVNK
ncbi:MAG: KilA-N domain-containing protein [Cyanobacteria bacterium J06633_8]